MKEHIRTPQYDIIGTVTDYVGRFWCVYQSRPTEHGWDVLLGRPAVDDGLAVPLKGGVAVIITKELAQYLKDNRLWLTPLRLPISRTVLHRIRRELGINFNTDYPLWWKQARNELAGQGIDNSSYIPFTASDCPKNWTKDELRRFLSLRTEGKSLQEVAALMDKKFRAVDALHRKLLGIKKPQKTWTKDDIQTLLALRKTGLTHKAIADRLQRSLPAIEGMLMRLFPGRGKAGAWQEEEQKELLRLNREGIPLRQIAKILGRTYPAVVVMRRTLISTAKKPRWTAEEDGKLLELLSSGLSQRETVNLPKLVQLKTGKIRMFEGKLFRGQITQ